MYALMLFLHVLGATVWTGGHLVLALTWLPRVLRERSPEQLLRCVQARSSVVACERAPQPCAQPVKLGHDFLASDTPVFEDFKLPPQLRLVLREHRQQALFIDRFVEHLAHASRAQRLLRL